MLSLALVFNNETNAQEFSGLDKSPADIAAYPSSYRVSAIFLNQNKEIVKADLSKKFITFEEAQDFLKSCKGIPFSVNNIEKKPGKRTPTPPFTTSTLQQEASRKLGFSVNQTMMVAQKLYESGKITYMRTGIWEKK